MTSLVEMEWYELWNGEEKGMTWVVEFRDFLVMRENMFVIKLICLFSFFFEVNIRYKCHGKV